MLKKKSASKKSSVDSINPSKSGHLSDSGCIERDLIAAIATATGPGAVGIVKLSGEGAKDCFLKVATNARAAINKPRTMVLSKVSDPLSGEVVDQALVVWFPAQTSYTGEDLAEIHGHGGSMVPRLLLEAVLSAGARLARPGEFTQRSFLNGLLSLDQAEAIAELAASQSRAEAALAARHLDGALIQMIQPIKDELKSSLANITVILDFIDEEWTRENQNNLLDSLSFAEEDLEAAVALGQEGRIYRDGLRVVLAGAPNAGKSSLFNALLGRERALVNPKPGTTRDYLEASVSWSGLRVELVDTAGLRSEGADELESQGQELAKRELEKADVALWLKDLSDPSAEDPPDDEDLEEKLLVVHSKADLAQIREGVELAVSSVTGSGLDRLKAAILDMVGAEDGQEPDAVPNLRQLRALEECLVHVKAAILALDTLSAPDLVALELKYATQALGQVSGGFFTEDVLDEVFSHFCVGK